MFTPTVSEHGWSAGGHTVVEVVTDDMPFLVDSVTMELNEQHRDVHMVVHPQFLVRRDITGAAPGGLHRRATRVDRASCRTTSPASRGCTSRSAGVRAEASASEIEQALAKVLQRRPRGRRGLAEDARPGARRSSRTSTSTRRRCPPRRSREGQALLRWLADNHFTFLGYREYRLEDCRRGRRTTSCCARCPAPASASCAPTRTCRASFGKLPPLVRAKAREKTLLVLAKANSKATVHRPVYLDYVGVKTFDESGEVVGERRFLGLFSLGRLHRVADPHPGDPR